MGIFDFVFINNVNYVDNFYFYVYNELVMDVNVCDFLILIGICYLFIEYDGFIIKFIVILNFIFCEIYYIWLVVFDVGDYYFDLVVFLEVESFNLGGEV